MITSKEIKRALTYGFIGLSTFLFDLLLLFILIDRFQIYDPLAAGIAFLIAVSVNYLFSRRLAFNETERAFTSGYLIFLLIVGGGFVLVVFGMYVAVEIFQFNSLLSRIIIAGFVGVFNYILNLFINFDVFGK